MTSQPYSVQCRWQGSRTDLQEWVHRNPESVGDSVRIVTIEFGTAPSAVSRRVHLASRP